MATIKDIAEKVGVSACTVSRYINNKIKVKEETAKKIDEAIIELDYHKNYLAAALKTRSSKMIALVIPSLKNIFFAEIAGNIAKVLEEKGYSMITFTTKNNFQKELEVSSKLLELNVAGAIFMTLPFEYEDGDHIEKLQANNIACLMINRFFESNQFTSVSTDFSYGVKELLNELIHLGSRKIGLIVGAKEHPQSDEYVQAYQEVLNENNIEYQEELVKYCYFDNKLIEQVVDQLVDIEVDTIVTISDLVALVAIERIKKKKLKIPSDIKIAGSGDTEFSRLIEMTSLDSKSEELGVSGAKMLLGLLNDESIENFVSVKPEIQYRKTT